MIHCKLLDKGRLFIIFVVGNWKSHKLSSTKPVIKKDLHTQQLPRTHAFLISNNETVNFIFLQIVTLTNFLSGLVSSWPLSNLFFYLLNFVNFHYSQKKQVFSIQNIHALYRDSQRTSLDNLFFLFNFFFKCFQIS